MKFKMVKDGFEAQGTFNILSKAKAFTVSGSYECEFKVSGDLDKKLHADIFDRYLAISMREMASAWQKKEDLLTAPLKKLMDSEEAELAKRGKTLSPAQVTALRESKQKALDTEALKLARTGLATAFEQAAAQSHAVAMATIAKEAKGVLKSNKAIAFRVVANIGAFAVGVTVTVVAGFGVGTAAAGPAGAVVGGVAAVVISAVAVTFKIVKTVLTMASAAKSMRADFKGNLKAYEDSLKALEKQFDETIKLSRGLTSKWDNLHLRQAMMQSELDDMHKSLGIIAPVKREMAKIDELRNKLLDEAKSLEKLKNYKPGEIEKELQSAKHAVTSKCGAATLSEGLEKANTWAGRLEQWVGSLTTTLDTINLGR